MKKYLKTFFIKLLRNKKVLNLRAKNVLNLKTINYKILDSFQNYSHSFSGWPLSPNTLFDLP